MNGNTPTLTNGGAIALGYLVVLGYLFCRWYRRHYDERISRQQSAAHAAYERARKAGR